MDRHKVIVALGLAADATDEQIYTAIASNNQKAETSEDLEAQLEQQKKQKVETLVATAILEKKITADQKKTYEDLATANYEATEKALKSMPVLEALRSRQSVCTMLLQAERFFGSMRGLIGAILLIKIGVLFPQNIF